METRSIPLDLIDPPLVLERVNAEGPDFQELVEDVRERGLLNPLLLRAIDGRYRVAAGFRRYRAAQAAGLLEVPAVVKAMDDAEELTTRARENLHRVNPNPVEEGILFATMHEGLGLTPDAIAVRVGKSRPYVAARLELVHGPEGIRDAVLDGSISYSVARELLRCPHPKDQENLLGHARRGGCTAELMRAWVQDATRMRAALPSGVDPATTVVQTDQRPVLTGICEWHEGQVALDQLLHLRVCGACYQVLLAIRERVKEDEAAAAAGGAHAPAGGPA